MILSSTSSRYSALLQASSWWSILDGFSCGHNHGRYCQGDATPDKRCCVARHWGRLTPLLPFKGKNA